MRFHVAFGLVSLSISLVGALAACSASGTSFVTGTDGTQPGPQLGTTLGEGSSGSSGKTPACTPDPSCARLLCECSDETVMATDGICFADSKGCEDARRCEAACGGSSKYTGGAFEMARCTSAVSCMKSEPNISCACSFGAGMNANAACVDGYCSSSKKDVCPSACTSQGGWTCRSNSDCGPVVCSCKDGAHPAVDGSCSGGTCGSSSAQCSSACASHGGTGTSTSTPDAGPPDSGATPKKPGDPCNAGSECAPFDCTCMNGQTYKGIKSCESKQCATKASACGLTCYSSGGWSGT